MPPQPSVAQLRRLGYPIVPDGGIRLPPPPRFPSDPPPLAEQVAELEALTAPQRVAAMYRGQLTLTQLCKWAARYPEQVAVVDGEFAFIAAQLEGAPRPLPQSPEQAL